MTKSKIILLVEDSENDAALALRAFKKNQLSCEVVVAADGGEALDYLFCRGVYGDRDEKDMPNLILLDLKLPEMDGLEVLRHLRSSDRTKYLPVVILTTSKEEEDILNSYELGCNSYIRKPVNFLEFTEVARQLGVYWIELNEIPHYPTSKS